MSGCWRVQSHWDPAFFNGALHYSLPTCVIYYYTTPRSLLWASAPSRLHSVEELGNDKLLWSNKVLSATCKIDFQLSRWTVTELDVCVQNSQLRNLMLLVSTSLRPKDLDNQLQSSLPFIWLTDLVVFMVILIFFYVSTHNFWWFSKCCSCEYFSVDASGPLTTSDNCIEGSLGNGTKSDFHLLMIKEWLLLKAACPFMEQLWFSLRKNDAPRN